MKESLIKAKEEFIQRFISAYDELHKYEPYQAQTVSFKHADIFSYDLKDYKNGKIKPGSKIYPAPPESGTYGKYGFNKEGRLTTAEIYSKGEKVWIGFFMMKVDLIEYIEFNIASGAPSSVKRMVLENGRKTLYQSCSTNGRSGFYSNEVKDRVDIVRGGFNDGHSAICTIEEYLYESNIIAKAFGLHIMPGAAEWCFEDVYTYKGNKLEQVKSFYENGSTNIKYIAQSKNSLVALSNTLAITLSDYLVTILQNQHFAEPLFSVELSYQYCYSYRPHLVVITEQQKKQAIEEKKEQLFTDGEFIYATGDIPIGLDELYAEFYKRLETTKNWEAGRKMLRQVATLMTKSKLKGCMPVTDDFIVFPIEWQLDMDQFEKILLQCGASKSNIKEWKKYGWV